MTESGNMFSQIPPDLPAELFETLAHRGTVRIERILSHGQATPEGEWYDQDRDEWVLLLAGSAGLLFDGEPELRRLTAGDYLMIPARRRHRVAWTAPNETTIWLAVHIGG
ncbi:cupin domain-containing protein [Oryzomonas sagensis]|uniref:Cupin domain-containing protein n=1 Tax=Oryzomonas sagensis TaxID=2603857 RepID=A0ABQ6TKW2_9BACT|nr:cupin domain-containing protein [Oryzomonas sagensis]KAB0668829.1 cupin domain-containing protein [Oryzomonas sagensis]